MPYPIARDSELFDKQVGFAYKSMTLAGLFLVVSVFVRAFAGRDNGLQVAVVLGPCIGAREILADTSAAMAPLTPRDLGFFEDATPVEMTTIRLCVFNKLCRRPV